MMQRALAEPERAFLGVEMASSYYDLVNHRLRQRGLGNVATICGEAEYLMACCLERGRADAVSRR